MTMKQLEASEAANLEKTKALATMYAENKALRAAMPIPKPADSDTAFCQMIERVSRDPAADIDKLERLLAMRERAMIDARKTEFARAMALAQSEMRPVAADASNPQTRSKFASYHALDKAVRHIYAAHGFALSFDTADGAAEGNIRVVCYLMHTAGHSHTYTIDMPADGKGARGGEVMSRTHATGSAVTYGKRYLLGMIFNIVVGNDDDGNAAGTTEQRRHTTLPKKDARDVYAKLQSEIDATKSVEELQQWGESNRERIAVLPNDWQDILRLRYQENIVGLRTAGASKQSNLAKPNPQENGKAMPSIADDPAAWLSWVDDKMSYITTVDALREFWDTRCAPNISFPPDEEAALEIYEKHVARINPPADEQV